MKRLGSCLLLITLLLSGCSAAKMATTQSEPSMNYGGNRVAEEMSPAAPMAAAPMEAGKAEYDTGAGGAMGSSVDQLVIQNGNLTIAVADPAMSMVEIIKKTEEMKGFVVNSNIYKTRNDNGLDLPEGHLTIRVPAERMTEAMDFIKAQTPDPATDVLSETRSGQNVTKEYTDQKSRLKNLEDAEAQLREIMASATKTEDVMSVFNQLTQVREQIEVTKGQIKYYEESAAMSAIEIILRSKSAVAPLSIGGWQPAGVARNAIQSLINTLKFFADSAIWIILFLLPVLVILIIPLWLLLVIIRAINRRNKAKKTATAPIPTEEQKKSS
ncbi:MAG: DUF4349 domain-containing protein [Leptolinea sp.]|jgi:hypothetical protein|nr:DUF4349 domain-containing protein [Leptolinea sp.]